MRAKHDRQGVKTAAALEQKWGFSKNPSQEDVQSMIRNAVSLASSELRGLVDDCADDIAKQGAVIDALERFDDQIEVAVSTLLSEADLGGRNLLLGSNIPRADSTYEIGRYNLGYCVPVEGETYTLRLKGQLGTGKECFWAFNSGPSVQLATLSDNGDGTYSATFAWKNTNGSTTVSPVHLRIYAAQSSDETASSIEWIKLEKGSVATEWTLAPEDRDAPELLVTAAADSTALENLTCDKAFAEIEAAIRVGRNVRVKLVCNSLDYHIYLQLSAHKDGAYVSFCGWYGGTPLLLTIT